MMQTEHDRLREIYLEANEITAGEQRDAFLAEACGGDAGLRARVVDMLNNSAEAGHFFNPFDGQEEHKATTVVLPPCTALQEGPGTLIGRYKLLEQIGEGGFGVVYMAEQLEPVYRRVALKIIKLGMDTRDVIARFDAERQALALMDHPNVARVLDAGATGSGRPYFVMDLVRGMSITEFCDRHRLSTRERLELFIPICHAVQHAHSKGIIHRDLKPSNILVTTQDSQPVPKIIDFGIAKAIQQPLTQKTLFTRFGQMIGTPVYMSPEHLVGEDVDTRSDVYSLGVVLYELLTGKQPFDVEKLRQAGQMEMLRVIQEEEPVPPSTRLTRLGGELAKVAELRHSNPRRLSELVRGDLDWITMKALQKDRSRRYATPIAVAEDLQRHLNHQPVQAGPPSMAYRAWKFVRRHQYGVAAALSIFFVVLAGFVLSTFGFLRVREERSRAVRAEGEARKQREIALGEAANARVKELRARQISYASDMGLASHALEQSNIGRALSLLRRHATETGANDLRGWEWRYLWQQCRSSELFQLDSVSNSVLSLAVSADGVTAAAADLGNTLSIWDLLGRKRIAHLAPVSAAMALSPDGRFIVTGDLAIREPQTGRVVRSLETDRWQKLTFSPDSRYLAGLSVAGVSVLECADWRLLGHYKEFGCTGIHIGGLAFSHDGEWLAVGGQDGRISILETRTGKSLRTWKAHDESITSLAVSPDSRWVASGSGFTGDQVKLWNAADGALGATLAGHRAWICSLAFSPDGALLASGSADQNIGIWDVEKSGSVAMLKGHSREVWCVVFLPDGKTLISGGKDGSVKVWRTPRPGLPADSAPAPQALAFTSKPGEALGIGAEGWVGRWSLPALEFLGQDAPLGSNNVQITSSPVKDLAAVADKVGQVKIWNSGTRTLITNLPLASGGRNISSVAFAAAAPLFVALVDGGESHVFNTASWQPLATWGAPADTILYPCCVSADGQLLAAGGKGPAVYALTNGSVLARLDAHQFYTDAVAFSPDGKWLATGSMDGTAKLWRVSGWQLAGTFTGHLLGVHSVAFSADCRRLATGSVRNEGVKLWDLATMQEVLNLSTRGGVTFSLGFSPDGNTLMAFSVNAGFRTWYAPGVGEE